MPDPSIRLHLRVAPGAGRSAVVGRYGRGWKVRVAPPPERGRANAELIRLLADTLTIPRDHVAVVGGGAGRDKVVALEGLTADEAGRRLDLAAAEGSR